MAALPDPNFYSKDYQDDWGWVDISKRNQQRIRPSELNVPPMDFNRKPTDNGANSDEGSVKKTPDRSWFSGEHYEMLHPKIGKNNFLFKIWLWVYLDGFAFLSYIETAMRVRQLAEIQVDEDSDVLKHVGVSANVASLIAENILSHPFVVLRRQCQVHHNSRKNHIMAVTLVPVVVRLHNSQGFTTLWKGLGSTLLIRGMSIAIEDLLSKFTPWPKEITWHSSLKSFSQHILLKCVSLAIMSPFYSASLVETVQSDIASEKPGVLDVFKDGMCRLVSWGSPQKGRMLPVWALIVPTVVCGLLKYLFSLVIQNVASRVIHVRNRTKQEKRGALPKDILSQAASEEIEATSAFIGMVSADVICYPLETILHRLYLQGTRTIVDNLDSGVGVIPILTNYEGIADCYESTISQEGVLGLYKGFGALVLQFAVQWAVVKLTKLIATEISILLRPSPKPKKPPYEIDPRPVLSPSNPLNNLYQYPENPKSPYAPSFPYTTP